MGRFVPVKVGAGGVVEAVGIAGDGQEGAVVATSVWGEGELVQAECWFAECWLVG